MTHASVFSGIGGPEVAATMLGWENLFHCEINPFGRAVLDYWYPNAKSYEDITTTDFSEWRGKVDVLTGGFPCQPFSYAGQRRGAEDDRYLWPYMFKCIDAVRPTWVVAENVAGILTMVEQGEVSGVETQGSLFDEADAVRRYRLRETFTLQRICDDLEGHGYAVQPVLIPACAVGAPHRRDRVFIVGRRMVADSEHVRLQHDAGRGEQAADIGTESRGGQDVLSEQIQRIATVSEGRQTAIPGHAPHAVGGGEGTHGEGGGIESDGSHEDKQPRQWGAASEWNSRFYELLRNAADASHDGHLPCDEAGNQSEVSGTTQGNDSKLHDATQADGSGRNAADTDGDRGCEVHQHMEPRQPDGAEPFGNGGERDAAGTRGRGYWPFDAAGCGERWSAFPTVSPVHRGNDGLPFPLDDLTISASKWRTESLKAYGNAIVPAVMYEIFRAIEIAETEWNNGNR